MSKAALEIALELADRATAPLKRSMASAEKSVASLDLRMSRMSTTVKALGAAFGGWQLARLGGDLIQLTDTYTLLENKLKLVTTSEHNLAQVQEQLYNLTLDTHGAYDATVTMYTRFARATEGAGTSQGDLLTVTRAVNEAILVSGATSQEAEAAIVQLSQGMASGVLRGEELNSVMEQTPRVARMIADGLGITIGQLRQYGKEGKLTTELVIDALTSQAGTVHEEFGRMSVTVGQAWQDVKTTFAGIINDGSQAASITQEIAGELQKLTEYLNENKDELATYFKVAADGFETMLKSGKKFLDIMVSVDEFISGKEHGSIRATFIDQQVQKIEGLTIALDELRRSNTPGKDSFIAQKEQELQLLIAKMDVLQMEQAEAIVGEINLSEAIGKTAAATEDSAEKSKTAAKDICKSNDDKLSCTEKSTQKINAALDRMFAEEERDAAAANKKLVQGYIKAAEGITDNWQLQAQDREAVELRAINAMVDLTETGTDEMENYWTDFSESTKDILHDFVESSVKLEFESIGDAFTSLLDSMLQMFVDWIAKMVANWAMSGLTQLMGDSLGGLSIGGSGTSPLSLASAANSVSGWFGGPTAGGSAGSVAEYFGIGGSSEVAPYVSGQVYPTINGGTAISGGLAYTGSATAGSQTMMAAQGMYSGLGSSGIGSGSGMLASYGAQPGMGAGYGVLADTTATTAAGGASSGFGAGMTGGASGAAALIAAPYIASQLWMAFGHKQKQIKGYSLADGSAHGVLDRGLGPQEDVYAAAAFELRDFNTAIEEMEAVFRRGGDTAGARALAEQEMSTAVEHVRQDLKILAEVYGDTSAQMALQLDGTVVATDRFIDHLTGFDVSMGESAGMLDMAKEAADGNADALNTLQQHFMDLGLGFNEASTATMAMVASINEMSGTPLDMQANATITVDVQGDATASATTSGWLGINPHTGLEYGENYDGGIFLDRAVFRPGQTIAERGAEAAVPLHAGPKTLKLMHDDIKRSNRPINIQVFVGGKELKDDIKVVVDNHISARNNRGLTTERVSW